MGFVLTLILAAVLLVLLGAVVTVHGMTHPYRQSFATMLAAGWPTTPEQAHLRGQSVSFTLRDKCTTEAFLIEGDQPNGPIVLWLHGFGSSRYSVLRSAGCFTSHVRGIVCFDQRGHGDAQARCFHFGQQEVADVFDIMNQLPDDWQTRPVVLLGKSAGAGIALEAACRMQQAASSEPARSTLLAGVMLEGAFMDLAQPLHRYFQRHHYPRYPIVPLAMAWMRWRCPVLRSDRVNQAASLNCPLWLLHGEHDDTADPEDGARLARAAARGRHVKLPDAGHHALATVAPAEYEGAIRDFFAHLD